MQSSIEKQLESAKEEGKQEAFKVAKAKLESYKAKANDKFEELQETLASERKQKERLESQIQMVCALYEHDMDWSRPQCLLLPLGQGDGEQVKARGA